MILFFSGHGQPMPRAKCSTISNRLTNSLNQSSLEYLLAGSSISELDSVRTYSEKLEPMRVVLNHILNSLNQSSLEHLLAGSSISKLDSVRTYSEKLEPMRVVLDHNLIITVLLNNNYSIEDSERLFEIMESDMVQVYLTEFGVERIRLFAKELQGDMIADQLVADILENVQVCPCLKSEDVYISNSVQNCHNRFQLTFSVQELYKRYSLEEKLK